MDEAALRAADKDQIDRQKAKERCAKVRGLPWNPDPNPKLPYALNPKP